MMGQGVLFSEHREPWLTWHYGFRYVAGKKKGRLVYRWTNHWLAHPCHDLAMAFEIGHRACFS